MKTTRPASFFSTPPPSKKQHTIKTTIEENMLDIPNEIWLEILKYFNKKQLRDLSPVNSFFKNLIAQHNLFTKAAFPIPDYQQLLPADSRHRTFDRLAYEENVGLFVLETLKNGDAIAATEEGRIFVLELGKSEWHEYGQHVHPRGTKGFVRINVHSACLLPCGLLATCGDDGIRLWDRNTKQQVQHLSFIERGWGAKIDGVSELTDGNLLASSKTNQFHLWRRIATDPFNYEYVGKLFGASEDKITSPYIWECYNDCITGWGNKFYSRWDIKHGCALQRVSIDEIKQRIARTMKIWRQNASFAAAHLVPEIITFFNDTADNVQHFELEFCWDIPDCLAAQGYALVYLGFFKFLLMPLDESIEPVYIGTTQEHLHGMTQKGDLIVARNVATGIEVLGGFDTKKNKFSASHIFPLGTIKYYDLLANGHAMLTPHQGNCFVFDIVAKTKLHDLVLDVPEEVDIDETCKLLLKNGELFGWHYDTKLSMNKFMIWDYQTGELLRTFLSRGEPEELANGDLLTHSRADQIDHLSVVRFGVKNN